MHITRNCFVAMFILLTAVGCSTVVDDSEDEVTERVRVGDRVPTFSVETERADGTTATFSTAALTGATVIVFFHTTCPDCQRDLPKLDSYYRQHQDEPGFQMVAISRAEDRESVAAYWKANGLSLPYSAQTDRRVYELFASSLIPRIYFCTAQGIVTRIDIERFSEDTP